MSTRRLTPRRCHARAATVPPFAPPGFVAPLSCAGVIVRHAAVTVCGVVAGAIDVRLITARRLDRHASHCARRSCRAAPPLGWGSLCPRATRDATPAFPWRAGRSPPPWTSESFAPLLSESSSTRGAAYILRALPRSFLDAAWSCRSTLVRGSDLPPSSPVVGSSTRSVGPPSSPPPLLGVVTSPPPLSALVRPRSAS